MSFGRLDPSKRIAHDVLDRVRDRQPVSRGAVNWALKRLGEFEPVQRRQVAP